MSARSDLCDRRCRTAQISLKKYYQHRSWLTTAHTHTHTHTQQQAQLQCWRHIKLLTGSHVERFNVRLHSRTVVCEGASASVLTRERHDFTTAARSGLQLVGAIWIRADVKVWRSRLQPLDLQTKNNINKSLHHHKTTKPPNHTLDLLTSSGGSSTTGYLSSKRSAFALASISSGVRTVPSGHWWPRTGRFPTATTGSAACGAAVGAAAGAAAGGCCGGAGGAGATVGVLRCCCGVGTGTGTASSSAITGGR